jgi:hypothetical protein
MYVDETIIPDDDESLMELRIMQCTIIRTPGLFWGTFLQFLAPPFLDAFDIIALILDDVFIPHKGKNSVNMTNLIETMDQLNVSTISPAIDGDTHRFLRPGQSHLEGCTVEVEFIETYVQLFTQEA